MVATQPKFKVEFKENAVLAIQRQQRGKVVMILNDSTNALIDRAEYRTLGDVKASDWSTANYKRITLAFMGNPYKVIIVKTATGSGEDFTDTLAKLNYYDNYTLCFPEAVTAEQNAIKSYINTIRQTNNYSRAVVANMTSPDAEYIINFTSSGNITANIVGTAEEFTPGDYTARIAGALCGLPASRSITYYEFPEIVNCPISATPDADVAAGKLVILHQDGTFKMGRGVNSLVTLTDGITEAFQKIRLMETMDMIANDIVTTFRTGYVGKYINNFTNKNRFVGAINGYLLDLAAEGLLEEANDNVVYISYEKTRSYLRNKGVDVDNMTYQQIITANTGSKVLLDGVCSPTDTMEDLDLGMFLFQAMQQIAA